MKKFALLLTVVLVYSLFYSSALIAQSENFNSFFPFAQLDNAKNSKVSMIKSTNGHIEIQFALKDLFDIPSIYDGKQRVAIIANYNIYIDEQGKFVKIEPVNKITTKPLKNFNKILVNPKEATDIMQKEVSRYIYKIGTKNKKPVKYIYNMELLVYASPGADKAAKDIITSGDEYFKQLEKMPQPLKEIRPVYPELARQNNVNGKVIVRVTIDEKGTPTEAYIAKGIGFGCEVAALDAVMNTKFSPGILKGKPVKVELLIPVIYELDKK